jgi:hypothetical protein
MVSQNTSRTLHVRAVNKPLKPKLQADDAEVEAQNADIRS